MRKAMTFAVLALMVAMMPGASNAGTVDQREVGVVRFPTRFPLGDPTTQGYPGLQRRVQIISQGLGNGLLGWVFDIPQETWCNEFKLTAIYDETHTADLDINFYTGWDDVFGEETVGAIEFETKAPGGETGVVPMDTTKGLVFTIDGVNASFVYESWNNDETDCE